MALTYVKASGIDITGNYTVNSLDATANVGAGNIKTDHLLYANGVAWNFGSTYSNTNVAAYLPTFTGNSAAGNFLGNGYYLSGIYGSNVVGQVGNALIAGTVYTAAQPNITSTGTLVSLNVSGNVSSGGNVIGTHYGNGYNLFGIYGSNVLGQVGNALVAGTVYTAAQPNITSVGTLTTVNVSGNVTAGNIKTDNLLYANGTAWSFGGTYSNSNVQAYLPTYSGILGGTLSTAAQPNVTQVGTLANLTISGNLSAGNGTFGSGTGGTLSGANLVSSNYFSGNGYYLSGIYGSNVIGQVGNALIAGTVYTAAQPNITSVGTLASVTHSVNSNITMSGALSTITGVNNVSANFFTGTLTTGAQPNVTQVGTLANLSVTGNVSSGGNVIGTHYGNGYNLFGIYGSNVIGQVGNALVAGTVYTAAQPNITSTGTLTSLNVSGNVSSGGNVIGTHYGNGYNLFGIYGSNVIGQVGNALVAGTVYTAAQPNITSVGTLSSVVVSGNANVVGTLFANAIVGSSTTNVTITAGTFVSSFTDIGDITLSNNVSVVANLTTSNLAVTGTANLINTSNVSLGAVGNVHISGGTNGYVLQTNGSGTLSWVNPGSLVVNANASGSNTQVQFNDGGSLGASAGFTFNKTANTLTVNGNITSTNANLGNLVIANYFTGTLTTPAQPNITSVGTLVDTNINGNVLISGNLTVNGTTEYTNVTNLYVKDPIIELGGGANNTPLASNDGKDRGTLLHYYTTGTVDAFMGWDNSNAEFGFGSNVSVSSEVVTWNNYGNVRVGNILGNGYNLSSLYGSNVVGQVGNALVAGTVYTNAQPNITSVGTLTSLDVTGNISSGSYLLGNGYYISGLPAGYSNADVAAYLPTYTGNFQAGNITLNSLGTGQIAISSSGLLVGGPDLIWEFSNAALWTTRLKSNGYITTTGNVTSGNAILGNLATANYFTGTLTTGSQPNITSTGTLTTLSVTGNISSGANVYGKLFGSTNTTLAVPGPANVSGERVRLYDFGNPATTNFAIGVEDHYIWNAVDDATSGFKWYNGNTLAATLMGNGQLTTVGNISVQGGYLTLGSSLIAVSGSNAGIFNTGVGNINLGLSSNLTIGSTTGNTTIRGNIYANNAAVTSLSVNDFYSNRSAVSVTTGTVVDQFSVNTYRAAKYTMRVNSDDGYQAVEALLVHDGSSAYVTIYGSISSSGSDIVALSGGVVSGNVEMYATTASANTTVKVMGTYIQD